MGPVEQRGRLTVTQAYGAMVVVGDIRSGAGILVSSWDAMVSPSSVTSWSKGSVRLSIPVSYDVIGRRGSCGHRNTPLGSPVSSAHRCLSGYTSPSWFGIRWGCSVGFAVMVSANQGHTSRAILSSRPRIVISLVDVPYR